MTTSIQYQPSIQNAPNITTHCYRAPLPENLAWEIESFFLKIFEYGDYSFRAALRGEMLPLNTIAIVTRFREKIIAAGMALFPQNNQGIALLGPLAVEHRFRRQRIASDIMNRLCQNLVLQGIACIYLAVKHNHPARSLYRQHQFQDYQGIVMRRLLKPHCDIDAYDNQPSNTLNIRPANWTDYCSVQQLLITPAAMICINYQESLFSSRVNPVNRFLSIFPNMMKKQNNGTGLTIVLASGKHEHITGLADISRATSDICRHRALLDFFIHDNFLEHADNLLNVTIKQCRRRNINQWLCYVPQTDQYKCNALKRIGAKPQATLPRQSYINNQWVDTLIYTI